MLDTAGIWRVEAPPGPQAERLAAGRPVDEARDMVGRVFNLCRAAQEAGFDIACGRPLNGNPFADEIRRDHLMQIFMVWPRALGLPPRFDRAWLDDDHAALVALFGATARSPRTDFEMAGFLGSQDGVAPLLSLINDVFGPRAAQAGELSLVDAETAFRAVAVENSAAARQAARPAMTFVDAMWGRGPLWRAAGRVMDLAAILEGDPPRPIAAPQGSAIVPATRGYYAVRVDTDGERVTALRRITPTDHLLAPGGALETMLARLPPDRGHLVPLLLALVDPCRPIRVEVARDA